MIGFIGWVFDNWTASDLWFFSKWYLIGGMVSQRWEYMVTLMFSTMVMVVLFSLDRRIHLAVDESGKNLGKGHGDLGLSKEQTRFDEAPEHTYSSTNCRILVMIIGVYNQEVVDQTGCFSRHTTQLE